MPGWPFRGESSCRITQLVLLGERNRITGLPVFAGNWFRGPHLALLVLFLGLQRRSQAHSARNRGSTLGPARFYPSLARGIRRGRSGRVRLYGSAVRLETFQIRLWICDMTEIGGCIQSSARRSTESVVVWMTCHLGELDVAACPKRMPLLRQVSSSPRIDRSCFDSEQSLASAVEEVRLPHKLRVTSPYVVRTVVFKNAR